MSLCMSLHKGGDDDKSLPMVKVFLPSGMTNSYYGSELLNLV